MPTYKYGKVELTDEGYRYVPYQKNGGVIKFQNGGYARAAGYYRNHANEGVIRKLQNFLYARGYDLGDSGIDGKFGQKTYEAIRKYQRDNGLKDDGM
ncbi:MAG: peptidoglycan-binding protein [Bacilli bacterium]|nr:peptidoglycan-binding protein [Bacilli bacterium]